MIVEIEIVYDFARWLEKHGWQVDPTDGYWFRPVEDELTPNISVLYTDEMLFGMFLRSNN